MESSLASGPGNVHLDRLTAMIGRERSLHETSQTLHFTVNSMRPRTVGAIHVTCADETESECAEALQQGFVQYLLPTLKPGRRVPMRLANPGGQYEWGTIRIADQHYAVPPGQDGFNLILVKINGHVGVRYELTADRSTDGVRGGEPQYGRLRRYGVDSACCGALDLLLSGSTDSLTDGIRELLASEGLDREAILRDPDRVDPGSRALLAALVSSRLQARKAVLDIQDYGDTTPTYWLVVPCVTLNRPERDNEIVCGIYAIDGRSGDLSAKYRGLGDDPSAFEIGQTPHGLQVSDEHTQEFRPARDHRALAREQFRRDASLVIQDERLDRIRRDVATDQHLDHRHAKALLRVALPLLAELAPIPTAILMFAEGAASLRHSFRIDRLARELEGSEDARRILNEVHAQVDQLDQDHAEALIEVLVKEYSG